MKKIIQSTVGLVVLLWGFSLWGQELIKGYKRYVTPSPIPTPRASQRPFNIATHNDLLKQENRRLERRIREVEAAKREALARLLGDLVRQLDEVEAGKVNPSHVLYFLPAVRELNACGADSVEVNKILDRIVSLKERGKYNLERNYGGFDDDIKSLRPK